MASLDAEPDAVAPPAGEPPLPVWIARDPASLALLEMVRKAAGLPSTVLILGESGTGKDQLAQLLHFLGPRRHAPMVKIDCAALPAELLESELFGYEKGAFTGAYQAKQGRLELAGEGTLVLDEIAALSLPLQAKLLRVIEEKRFERLGGHTAIHIQARLLALTNVDLEKAVARRDFRADLFYRLFVLPMQVPPLRERRGDILPLAEHFLRELDHEHAARLTAEARQALGQYGFPGNVRELRHLLSRALMMASGPELGADDFPAYVRQAAAEAAPEKSLQEVEKEHIAAVLQRFRGRKQMAAAALGISPKTLLEKRRKYGLDAAWTDRLPPGVFSPARPAKARRPH